MDNFQIPRRINDFIKSLRHPFRSSDSRPVLIVIDSIKNIFEATYLRERYSAFYLFAISSDEDVRISRLMDSAGKNMTKREIKFIDWQEYSDVGRKIYNKYKGIVALYNENKELRDAEKALLASNSDEVEFTKRVLDKKSNFRDEIRIDAFKNNLCQFSLQDVGTSIENADVFISNNYLGNTPNTDLKWEIVRNVSLIMYPGLLLPTPIERCMQAAFAAKANSGCLSRQVGAVVTDADYNILTIGWNDVPCGDISCARKNISDLNRSLDLGAYTNYEITDASFRQTVSRKLRMPAAQRAQILCGLPHRYCFKDLYAEIKDPMKSRAMHAEEKALGLVGDRGKDGFLFTTSSPCEMCSKNAKNHQIKKIYYIEPYPGISEDQYTESGNLDNRAKHILFTGAIGRAYTQMYTPIMPHKDILNLLGING